MGRDTKYIELELITTREHPTKRRLSTIWSTGWLGFGRWPASALGHPQLDPWPTRVAVVTALPGSNIRALLHQGRYSSWWSWTTAENKVDSSTSLLHETSLRWSTIWWKFSSIGPSPLFLGGGSNLSLLELILVPNRDLLLCSQNGSSRDLIFHGYHLRTRNSLYGWWQWDSLFLTCNRSHT